MSEVPEYVAERLHMQHPPRRSAFLSKVYNNVVMIWFHGVVPGVDAVTTHMLIRNTGSRFVLLF